MLPAKNYRLADRDSVAARLDIGRSHGTFYISKQIGRGARLYRCYFIGLRAVCLGTGAATLAAKRRKTGTLFCAHERRGE